MKRRLGIVIFGGLVLATAGGCVGGSKGLSAEDKERLKQYVLEAVPADAGLNGAKINFENRVWLVGFKADPTPAKPGTEVTLTFVWQCVEAIDKGWKLYTHIEEDTPEKRKLDNLDFRGSLREDPKNNPPQEQVLGPDKWEKGKFYVDTIKWKVPDDVKAPRLRVLAGIWKEDARLGVTTGPKDGDGRGEAGYIQTGLAPVQQPDKPQHGENDVPRLDVPKLAHVGGITVDGKGDEPAWGGAVSTGPFVPSGTARPQRRASPTAPRS